VRAPLGDCLDLPVQFFTGKGGVGKSTVITALAKHLARAGRRPLIVELGVHTSSAHLFDRPSVSYEPVEVTEGVHATRVLFEPALVDYVTSRLKLRPLAKLVAKNGALRRLFLAAPGVDEVVRLHRIAELGDDPRWDPVLVDLESTGHALMFFDLPGVLDVFLEDGPLRQVLDSATRMLRDPERAAIHIVTVPEPLAVRETIELYRALRERNDLRLGRLFINRVPPGWFDAVELEELTAALQGAQAEEGSRPWFALVEHVAARQALADKCIHGLQRDIDLPTCRLSAEPGGTARIVEAVCDDLGRCLS